MNARWTPYRSGWRRGLAEIRQMFVAWDDLMGFVMFAGLPVLVMYFLRNTSVENAPVSLGSMTIPSLLGMNVAFAGLMVIMQGLTIEREDGTLLRAKAVPGGMTGYLVAKIVSVSAFVLCTLVIILTLGLLLFDGLQVDGLRRWLTLLAVLTVGLIAILPIGAVLGSVFRNPRNTSVAMLPIMGLIATSGIFYPLSSFPSWLQAIGQVFPVYWLGLGMRSALLPGDMAAVEIGGSWRHLETFGMLGLWAVLGLTLAPIVLRRMARRESGSEVAARRERAMQRVT